jgi:hypothetical protein
VFVLGLMLLVAIAGVVLDRVYFIAPLGQIAVTVVGIQSGSPTDKEHLASFRHLVELADGTRLAFDCDRILRPGDRVLVTATRSTLTNRIRLSPPYVVAAEQPTNDPAPRDAPVH